MPVPAITTTPHGAATPARSAMNESFRSTGSAPSRSGSNADSSRVTSDGQAAVCRGVEVTVRLDPERFIGSGLFLFAAVLERFLAVYCSVNSFTKLIATVQGREGELRRWQPRQGERILA